MPNPVEGKNVTLSMKVSGVYYPILCGTETTYNKGVEFIEKTGPNSGQSRQWMKRLKEYTSTITGLTKINNDANLSFFYLLDKDDEYDLKIVFEDDETVPNVFTIYGPALIGTMGISGAQSQFAKGNIEIRWNGEPTIGIIPPPTGSACIQAPLYLTFTAGATSVSNVLLQAAGVVILAVEREGMGMVQTTGTPAAGSREFKFTGGTGTIEFDSTNPSNGETVYVLYKIT